MRFVSLAPALLATALAAGTLPPTRFERSGGLETPRLAETVEECRALAKASPWVRVGTFGRSPQGRDLPLVIVDRDRAFDPARARAKGKLVVMIQACIHAGESDGKDAGLRFLKELCVERKHPGLLDRLVFVFLPVFNVDGHERFGPHNRINQNGPKEMGWRSTAAGLNLNRDYLKADAPEMRAWLKLHQAWLPDVFLDCHSTDGADYQYPLTIAREAGPGDTWFLEPRLGAWIRDSFLPGLRSGLEADGMPTTEYIVFRTWHDPRSGLVIGPSGPRYSQGYQSAQNRMGILLETHMLKPYPVRVEATRLALLRTSEIVAREHATVARLNREADAFTASAAFRAAPMSLGFKDDGTSEPMAFKGFAYDRATSDLTGGDWFTYDPTRPQTFQIPRYGHLVPTATARVPEAYLVPPEWTEVIARLEAQGIPHHRLAKPATVAVSGWRFRDVVFRRTPTEGRQRVESLVQEEFAATRDFPAGTVVVPTGNRLARIIVHLLEPASEESLLRWGFFNTIFEQKEYGESYVLEPLARKMLAADPALKAAYERRKAEDKAFAANPDAQLNWFYQRSPWGDPGLGLYPVGRIFDAAEAAKL